MEQTIDNREIKHDVTSNSKQKKMKLLPFVFSCIYDIVKIFLFVVISRRHLSILSDLFKNYKKRIKNQR